MDHQPLNYLDEGRFPLPFCPGCGHKTILEQLNQALADLELDPRRVVIVTDIGCAGLSDQYFITNALHGLHGRSVTYATGIKMADPELTVIVLIGDGGFGIGGHHMINAARRNIGVKVIVFNNFNYGMTGGEHSVTTPLDARTSTTPGGNIEHPLDICGTVGINGAAFTARATIFDPDLPDIIKRAVAHEGFSVVDIWELCSAYFAPGNRLNKRTLEESMREMRFEKGILIEKELPEFSRLYRERVIKPAEGQGYSEPKILQPAFSHALERPLSLRIAGAAGAKIRTAGTMLCQGAMLSGLHVSQRNDYPVTVKTGHSISKIILSPTEIFSTSAEKADVTLVLFEEGFKKSLPEIQALSGEDQVWLSADLPEVKTPARIRRVDFRAIARWGRKTEYRALMAAALYLRESGIYPLEAFRRAIELNPRYAEDNLAAVEAALSA